MHQLHNCTKRMIALIAALHRLQYCSGDAIHVVRELCDARNRCRPRLFPVGPRWFLSAVLRSVNSRITAAARAGNLRRPWVSVTRSQDAITDPEMLRELEPTAAANVNRHLSVAVEWYPHDYVPWDR